MTQHRVSLSASHETDIFNFVERNQVLRKSRNSQENWTELMKKPGRRGDTNELGILQNCIFLDRIVLYI